MKNVTKEGFRQGRALSRILFILIMVDVAKEIKSKIKQTHVGCIFADDLAVFTKNRSELM